MKILWCGPFYSDLALTDKRTPNQAAARWSRGLLRGLEACGVELRVIDHCPEQVWPRGRVFWQSGNQKWFLDWFPCERIGYLNVVGMREFWRCWQYRRAVQRVLKVWRPDVVLAYNSLHPFHVAAMAVAKRAGVKCVPIILDGDDPRRDDWGWIKRTTKDADGIVFLSWWMKEHCPVKVPLLHMDGGAEEFKGECRQKTSSPFVLVHTGALDYWRGLNFMRGVIAACKRTDVKFVFCGKCDREKMWRDLGSDPRVEVKGFVSAAEVDEICRKADVFLNVREPNVGDNVLNYPSKVPQYLAWGKPVVSTWIDSFSPDYRDVLEVCDNTPEGFAKVLDGVLEWSEAKRSKKFDQIKSWFEERKSWAKQAERLVDFVSGIDCD